MRNSCDFEMLHHGHVRGVLTVQDAGDFDIVDQLEITICDTVAAVWPHVDAYAQSTLPWAATVRIAGITEAQEMNRDFRHKDYATNVLSFPNEEGAEPDDEEWYVGDILICWPVVLQEAVEQGKTPLNHLRHMVVHGMLHLVGYDHELGPDEAKEMEQLEIDILARMNVSNPYNDEDA